MILPFDINELAGVIESVRALRLENADLKRRLEKLENAGGFGESCEFIGVVGRLEKLESAGGQVDSFRRSIGHNTDKQIKRLERMISEMKQNG